MSTAPRRDASAPIASHAETFRRLHHEGPLLRLANAWDAGSARILEACGAPAIATTSAGVAWAHGYPDGNALPTAELVADVARMARVLTVPLSVDVEGGYSGSPAAVGETVAAVASAGAVGINLEDGGDPPATLCAKIEASKAAARRAGVDLFVNARTDVYLRGLVAPEKALAETLARAARYRDAGCDGLFVPYLAAPEAIREIVAAAGLPLNLLVVPKLPSMSELERLGVRRVSAGSSIAATAYGLARTVATQFLAEGRCDTMLAQRFDYQELNGLFPPVGA